MKLAYITASFPFGIGETFLIPEIASLSRAINGSVIVIPLHPRGPRRSDWQPPRSNVRVLEEKLFSLSVLHEAGKTICHSPLRSLAALKRILRPPGRHAVKNLAVFAKAMWLAQQIKLLGIEHLHVHWAGTTSTMAMLAAEVAGIDWSLTCHRWDIYENNLLSLKSQSARFVRFISERGMQDAVRLGVPPAKAYVGHMGVERMHARAARILRRQVPVIMCAANLLEVKGHRYLLQALRLIRDMGIHVSLKLAGVGALQPELEALVRSLGLERDVEFLGHVDQQHLLALYEEGAVDLFVLASVDLGNGHHEGVPVCLMEAMSHGIPVVSTKTGSIEELVDPSLGLTVPDKDAAALAKAITDLVSQPLLYNDISRRMTEIIRNGWLIDDSARELLRRMQEAHFEQVPAPERSSMETAL